jgi:hypothetical protein
MNPKILLLLFLFSAFIVKGQEIKLNSPIIATAGNNPELSAINISKWRIGEVHLIVLNQEKPKVEIESKWSVSSYPNPFIDLLNLDFKTQEINDFTIQVSDILGKKQYYNLEQTILPNQVINFDLSFLSPAMYLVIT